MTLRLHHLWLVSFNCRDWYNARSTVADLPVSYDICLIQEHWLFSDHLYQLNFNPDFLSVGFSGMESSILLWWVRNSFQEIIDHAYSLNTDIRERSSMIYESFIQHGAYRRDRKHYSHANSLHTVLHEHGMQILWKTVLQHV